MSVYTGTPKLFMMHIEVETNVYGVVMTSSPG
jgi:hypothetical protein